MAEEEKVTQNNQSAYTVCCAQVTSVQMFCSIVRHCLQFWMESKEMGPSGLKNVLWLGNCAFSAEQEKGGKMMKQSCWEWHPRIRS